MEIREDLLVSPAGRYLIDGDVVTAIRTLAARKVAKRTIAREAACRSIPCGGIYATPLKAGHQVRPPRRFSDDWRSEARRWYIGAAAGNAVVVQRVLAERGLAASERTVQRAVADLRREQRVAALATVRMETGSGEQLQIDFSASSTSRSPA